MNKYNDYIILLISFLFILLFSYTAVSKLLDYDTFQAQVSQFKVLKSFAGLVTWSIPNIELIISIMLMVTRTRKAGLYSSFILMLLFTAFVAGVLLSSDKIPCSCGGVLTQLSWEEHLIFNGVSLLMALGGIIIYPKKGHPKPVKKTKVFIAIDQE